MPRLTGGQVLIDCLERQGVRHVFGIPGDVTVPIYAALQRSTLNHITTRHEQGAGFMADGYYRASRKHAVVVVISGPGVTNVATAMGEAYTDSVPLLVFSADVSTNDYGKSADFNHEISDQRSLTDPICAKSIRVESIRDIPTVVNDAFEYLRTHWPRTIHIGIPTNILEESGAIEMQAVRDSIVAGPELGLIRKAATMLGSSAAPIIILGGGSYPARQIMPRLAESINAPVITTMNGKDSFPNDHPLYIGSGFHFSAIIDALNSSDVILAVGTQLGRSDFPITPVANALPQYSAGEKPLIRVDITPTQLEANISAELALLGDSKVIAESLFELTRKRGRSLLPRRAQGIRKDVDLEASSLGEKYRQWLYAVRESMPPNGVIAIDSTLVAYLGFPFIDIPTEGSWLYPSAFGTLGYALPAAIGAKFADRSRPAIAIIGDGGFLFTCTELITAVENRISLPVVVWNDHGFGTIRQGMISSGIRPLGVDFSIPDLASLAAGFGCLYDNPRSPVELGHCIRRSSKHDRPTIIEVIDYDSD